MRPHFVRARALSEPSPVLPLRLCAALPPLPRRILGPGPALEPPQNCTEFYAIYIFIINGISFVEFGAKSGRGEAQSAGMVVRTGRGRGVGAEGAWRGKRSQGRVRHRRVGRAPRLPCAYPAVGTYEPPAAAQAARVAGSAVGAAAGERPPERTRSAARSTPGSPRATAGPRGRPGCAIGPPGEGAEGSDRKRPGEADRPTRRPTRPPRREADKARRDARPGASGSGPSTGGVGLGSSRASARARARMQAQARERARHGADNVWSHPRRRGAVRRRGTSGRMPGP